MNEEDILKKLSRSKFRNSFHLNNKMKEYVKEKGIAIIKEHAYHFVNERLSQAYPKNDGKQTPVRQVHPVFIAAHACACCCRGCIEKWHHISKGKLLSNDEINYIVSLIMTWISKEIQ